MEDYADALKRDLDAIRDSLKGLPTSPEKKKLLDQTAALKGKITELPKRVQIDIGALVLEKSLLNAEIAKLKERIAKLETDSQGKDVKIQEQNVKIAKLETEVKGLKTDSQGKDVKIQEQNVKIQEQNVKIQEQNVKIAKLENQLMFDKTTFLVRQLIYTYIHEIASLGGLPNVWDMSGIKNGGDIKEELRAIWEEASKTILATEEEEEEEEEEETQDLLAYLERLCNEAVGDAHPVHYPFTRRLIVKKELEELIKEHYRDDRLINLLNEVANLRQGKSLLVRKN